MAEFDKKEQLGMPGYVTLIRMAGQSLALFGACGGVGSAAWGLLSGQLQYAAPLSQALVACTIFGAWLRNLGIELDRK